MPERPACVARELTKMHEEVLRGTLATVAKDRDAWRGEIAIVLGSFEPETRGAQIDDAAIDARIDRELEGGTHAKTVADVIAAWSGRPRREIYERVVRRKSSRRDGA
jgi:16S rRNA (cytidine1402-2'-O)-methyltransferase